MRKKRHSVRSAENIVNREKELDGRFDRRLANYNRMQRVNREEISKQEFGLKVLRNILDEREEIHRQHEEKLVQFKDQYDKKLALVEERARKLSEKEKHIKNSAKDIQKSLAQKARLEKRIEKLEHEDRIVSAETSRHHEELEDLRLEEAHVRVEVADLQRRLGAIQKTFDNTHSSLEEVIRLARARKNELATLSKEIALADKKHEEVTSDITYHSKKEVQASLRRARDHIKHGDVGGARDEYDRIRSWYIHLPRGEKKKFFGVISRLKQSIST